IDDYKKLIMLYTMRFLHLKKSFFLFDKIIGNLFYNLWRKVGRCGKLNICGVRICSWVSINIIWIRKAVLLCRVNSENYSMDNSLLPAGSTAVYLLIQRKNGAALKKNSKLCR